RVCAFGHFGDMVPPGHHVVLATDTETPAICDDQGETTVRGDQFFNPETSRYAGDPSASLYVLDEQSGLVAIENVKPSEFGTDKVREVQLRPACRVSGEVVSLG